MNLFYCKKKYFEARVVEPRLSCSDYCSECKNHRGVGGCVETRGISKNSKSGTKGTLTSIGPLSLIDKRGEDSVPSPSTLSIGYWRYSVCLVDDAGDDFVETRRAYSDT